MIDTIVEMFSYPFMVRAFAVGSLVALCAALLGVSLVLKQYSMIGDGLLVLALLRWQLRFRQLRFLLRSRLLYLLLF